MLDLLELTLTLTLTPNPNPDPNQAEPAAQEAAQAGWARRHGMPGRAARRIGHGVVICLFAAAACVGWQVSSRGRGAQDPAYKMRRVASFLNLRPHKTLECNV